MTWPRTALYLLCALAIAVTLNGCGQGATQGPAKTTESQPASEAVSVTQQDIDASKVLGELPEADRLLAQQQKTCPVSDEPLGSMGKPLKLNVNGQDVFICCKSCQKKIEADPDKYLAKLSTRAKTD